jgi:hypothetical protein
MVAVLFPECESLLCTLQHHVRLWEPPSRLSLGTSEPPISGNLPTAYQCDLAASFPRVKLLASNLRLASLELYLHSPIRLHGIMHRHSHYIFTVCS